MPKDTREDSAAQEGRKRLPWMRFYPRDWKSDDELRSCSFAARGLWMELICVMHGADPTGYLLVKGKRPTLEQIAKMTGGNAKECKVLLAELEAADVYSRTENGTIFSRKMVRNSRVSETNSENARKRWELDNSEEFDGGNAKHDASRNAKPMPTRARTRDRDSEVQSLRTLESDDSKPDPDLEKAKRAELLDAFSERDFDDGQEWDLALGVLTIRGGKSEKSARTLIGKIKADFQLRPLELAKVAAAAWRNGTQSPEGYMRATARNLASERGSAPQAIARSDGGLSSAEQELADKVALYAEPQMRKIKDDHWRKVLPDFIRTGIWERGDGPRPSERFCRVPADILREFGIEPK